MSVYESIFVGLFLAYYWTAFEMVAYHSNSRVDHRPAYVNDSKIRRFAGGLIWPVTSKSNGEFGWFFSCFVSYTILLIIALKVISAFIPLYVCILAIGIIRLIPIIQNIFTIPAAVISAIFWRFVASPMGSKMPNGINDFGKLSTETNKATKQVSEADQSIDTDYQTKIDNLLAVKGAREEYMHLQGWDPDYGSRSVQVCKLAEKVGEDPIILAALLLESLNYYHKNRDVSLSYLARLESGYAAKIANPELAREVEVEATKKEEFVDLIDTIDLEANSPEANYIRQVNEYIHSVGHFNSLVAPALKNNSFSKAVSNVYMTGYICNSSPKVIGMLIADGANKFKSNAQFGILFLDNVAKNMRSKYDTSLQNGKGSTGAQPHSEPTIKNESSNVPNQYHDHLDKISNSAFELLKSFNSVDSSKSSEIKLMLEAELVLYLVTFKAWIDSKIHIYPGTWNTFKRSIEVRMLSLKDDGHTASGVVRDSKGNQSFAHFVSSYWQQMDELECTLRDNDLSEFADNLLSKFDIDSSNAERFAHFFEATSKVAAGTVLKEVIAMEG